MYCCSQLKVSFTIKLKLNTFIEITTKATKKNMRKLCINCNRKEFYHHNFINSNIIQNINIDMFC